MILVLGGTTEGRKVAVDLEKENYRVMVSTVTGYGKNLMETGFGGRVSEGARDVSGLVELMEETRVVLLVDATHPFAVNASRNAREACSRLGIPYLRLEREEGERELVEDHPRLVKVCSLQEAVAEVQSTSGRIFLSVGSNSLREFVAAAGKERLIARVLPTVSSLQVCEEQGLSPGQLVAAKGPFTREFNREMFAFYGVSSLVTKDSGHTGGVMQKIGAARDLGLKVILIKRPRGDKNTLIFNSPEEVINYVKSMYKG